MVEIGAIVDRLEAQLGRAEGPPVPLRAASPTATIGLVPMPTCRPEVPIGSRLEVDIFGRWVGGEVGAEPLFDPRGERVRAKLG